MEHAGDQAGPRRPERYPGRPRGGGGAAAARAGPAAVTTRAVAQAAGVQAPTIYRLFGDKDGLLDAVAEHVFAAYVAGKSRAAGGGDPVADLRAGWDVHIGFGLANPALFGLLTQPGRDSRSPAAAAGLGSPWRPGCTAWRPPGGCGSASAAPLS